MTVFFLAPIIEIVDRTKSIVFWTGLQCSNQPPHRGPLCKRTRCILKQEVSVCPCCLSGQRSKKYSKKSANTLMSLLVKGAVKRAPSIPHFPTTIINEEIALEEITLTAGITHRSKATLSHSLPAQNIPNVSTSNSLSQQKMNAVSANQGCGGYFCGCFVVEGLCNS